MNPAESPHLRPVPDPGAGATAEAVDGKPWDGITPPRSRGVGTRFLTDVIIELGLAAPERVEAAIETARAAGRTPESVLLERGEIDEGPLARAIAERHGLDHLDLSVFNVDMGAANLISSASARRYEAVPVGFVGKRSLRV